MENEKNKKIKPLYSFFLSFKFLLSGVEITLVSLIKTSIWGKEKNEEQFAWICLELDALSCYVS